MTVKERQLEIINRRISDLEVTLLKLKKKREEIESWDENYIDSRLRISEIPELKEIHPLENYTVEEVLNSSPQKLLQIRSFGQKKLTIVLKWMDEHDLHFMHE